MTSHNAAVAHSDSDAVRDGLPVDLRAESALVRETLSALGRLLGAALIEPPRDLNSFVARHLQTSTADVAVVTANLRGIDTDLVHVAVARLLQNAPTAVLTDDLGTGAPGYDLVAVDVETTVAAPNDLAAFIPAGDGFAFDVVLVLGWENSVQRIALHTRRADTDEARAALSVLVQRALGGDNFYRGQTLQVTADDRGLNFRPITPSRQTRAELIHSDSVWREVDANIGGLMRHGDLLSSVGLGRSRGLLVVGPPGVGKTALCRVIASELPEDTTIIIVNAGVTPRGLGRIYDALDRLAPAAVFLDDIDLLAGDRRDGSGSPALRELLTHLDGFDPLTSVITVATTNVIEAVDPALIRAGRFDSVIAIEAPDEAAREQILRRYLNLLGSFDVAALAAATANATGADLREIVRRGVLECGRELATIDLLAVISTGRWRPAPPTGQYL